MGRRCRGGNIVSNLNSCMHDDCFTCPYPDCISSRDPKSKKGGRKTVSEEEKQRRRRASWDRYHDRHKEEINERRRKAYHKKKEGKNEGRKG